MLGIMELDINTGGLNTGHDGLGHLARLGQYQLAVQSLGQPGNISIIKPIEGEIHHLYKLSEANYLSTCTCIHFCTNQYSTFWYILFM